MDKISADNICTEKCASKTLYKIIKNKCNFKIFELVQFSAADVCAD
jgi:hypothetical protein